MDDELVVDLSRYAGSEKIKLSPEGYKPAVVQPGVGGGNAIVWATSEVPLTAWIDFPPTFTKSDRAKAWEALRAIYEAAVNRELVEGVSR